MRLGEGRFMYLLILCMLFSYVLYRVNLLRREKGGGSGLVSLCYVMVDIDLGSVFQWRKSICYLKRVFTYLRSIYYLRLSVCLPVIFYFFSLSPLTFIYLSPFSSTICRFVPPTSLPLLPSFPALLPSLPPTLPLPHQRPTL